MLPEWMSPLILGSILTLAASLVTLFSKYYIDIKQKNRERVIEQTESIIGSVYSPLLFYLSEVAFFTTNIRGSLTAFLEYSASKGSQQAVMIFLKGDIESFSSNPIREVLHNKIGFIRPIKFRRELFIYFIALCEFENHLKKFAEKGFTNIEEDIKFLDSMNKAAIILSDSASAFVGFLDRLMEKREKGVSDSEYEKIFPHEDFKKAIGLIFKRKDDSSKS